MTWWNDFWTYVQSLPESAQGYALGAIVTIIGVLLGSFFTLLGVISTNRTNQHNLRAQLRHDEATRAREHALGLRKQIYLEVAEIFAIGLKTLTDLQDLKTPAVDVYKAYSSRSSKLAQVHVVASEDTAICLSNFARAISTAYFELRLARKELDQLYGEIQIHKQTREYHAGIQKEIFDIFQRERIAGVVAKDRMSGLFEKMEKELQLVKESATKESELGEKLRPLHHNYCQLCTAENTRLSRETLQVIASVRRDLGMPIDESKYSKALEPTAGYTDNLSRLFGVPLAVAPADLPTATT